MTNILKYGSLTLFAGLVLFLASCSKDPASTGWEYAPQMFHSIPLEPFSQKTLNPIFADGLNAQKPPVGTIPRDSWYYSETYTPYPIANRPEVYDSAAAIKSPLVCSDETFKEGKRLYETFCIVCHGAKGKSDGKITANAGGPYPPPPNHFNSETLRNLPEGKIFHTITYGKNLMGSYASQLTPRQRWQVICYVQSLQQLTD
jgi:mono/diheme cytochrome c family protein